MKKTTEPWVKTYNGIKQRCLYLKYGPYYKKGIKALITKEELKTLWFRDNADKMKKPSIHRIDSNGNYEFKNCKYIELSENIRIAKTILLDKRKLYIQKNVSFGNMPTANCFLCNYKWIPRKDPKDIAACPNCKRYDWNKKEKP